MKVIFCIKSSTRNLSIHPSMVNLPLQLLRHRKERRWAFLPRGRQHPYRTTFPAWSLSPCSFGLVLWSQFNTIIPNSQLEPFRKTHWFSWWQREQRLSASVRGTESGPWNNNVTVWGLSFCVSQNSPSISLCFHDSVPALLPTVVCLYFFL